MCAFILITCDKVCVCYNKNIELKEDTNLNKQETTYLSIYYIVLFVKNKRAYVKMQQRQTLTFYQYFIKLFLILVLSYTFPFQLLKQCITDIYIYISVVMKVNEFIYLITQFMEPFKYCRMILTYNLLDIIRSRLA